MKHEGKRVKFKQQGPQKWYKRQIQRMSALNQSIKQDIFGSIELISLHFLKAT